MIGETNLWYTEEPNPFLQDGCNKWQCDRICLGCNTYKLREDVICLAVMGRLTILTVLKLKPILVLSI